MEDKTQELSMQDPQKQLMNNKNRPLALSIPTASPPPTRLQQNRPGALTHTGIVSKSKEGESNTSSSSKPAKQRAERTISEAVLPKEPKKTKFPLSFSISSGSLLSKSSQSQQSNLSPIVSSLVDGKIPSGSSKIHRLLGQEPPLVNDIITQRIQTAEQAPSSAPLSKAQRLLGGEPSPSNTPISPTPAPLTKAQRLLGLGSTNDKRASIEPSKGNRRSIDPDLDQKKNFAKAKSPRGTLSDTAIISPPLPRSTDIFVDITLLNQQVDTSYSELQSIQKTVDDLQQKCNEIELWQEYFMNRLLLIENGIRLNNSQINQVH